MGIWADLYVSIEESAIEYGNTPKKFADREQYTGFTVLELSTLWAAMQGVEWDVKFMDEFMDLLGEEERWLYQLPSAMVAQLTRMTGEESNTMAKKWAATDELASAPDEVLPIIEGLNSLARKADTSGRSAYFWNCL